jgi:hypothetical protein
MYPYWSMEFPAGLLLLLLLPALAADADETADQIVVRKATRELVLLRGQRILRTYRIALGRTPTGAKEQEGDGKTPEGATTPSSAAIPAASSTAHCASPIPRSATASAPAG